MNIVWFANESVFQVLGLTVPVACFHLYATNVTGQIEKLKKQEELAKAEEGKLGFVVNISPFISQQYIQPGPPTQLFARAADFSDVTTDCDVTKFYETFFCSVFWDILELELSSKL